jgi:hypothetical protein
MFRIGGSANEGIVSMAQPRKNYEDGSDYSKRIAELKPVLREALGPGRSERDRFLDMLLRGSIRLASERPVGGGIIPTIAKSFQEPVEQYLKSGETEEALQRQIDLTAATQGISSVEAERLQRMKLQAEVAGQAEKLKLAKEELFVKSPVGVALGSASKSVFNTLEDYNRNKIPYYEKPLSVNTNTKRVDSKQVEQIPVGVRFYDVNGDFYVRTEKGYKSIYAESGKEVAPIVPEKKPGFFDKTKEQGAAYDPRSWNKQKFYESLAKKNPPSTME